MDRGSCTWPLRIAGAAIFFAGCSAVAPYHLGEAAHPDAISKAAIRPFEIIEHRGLKVLLRRGSSGLKLSCQGGIRLLDGDSGAALAELGKGSKAQLLADHGILRCRGQSLGAAQALLEPLERGDEILVGGLSYRGRLFLKASGDSLLLVNEVGLDEYLYGVLPGEVGSGWPLEALKAQAVAARTYALFRAGDTASKLYDLDDSTRSQVYFGRSKEARKTSQAVDETSGLILTWHGAPAETFFHANCGGHTADAAQVWGSHLPYLSGVEDSFCDTGPHFAWHSEIDHDRLLRILAKAGLKLRDFDSIEAGDRDASGRCRQVVFKGDGPPVSMGAQAFRVALGPDLLRSTNFQASRHGDTHHFEGRGWGHGVGLCQEGAYAMAKAGYRFGEILVHYFPGTKVKRLVSPQGSE
jgi:stage II sporulation protein D